MKVNHKKSLSEMLKEQQEKKAYNKFYFMFMLGTAIALHEKLGLGPKRRKEIISCMAKNINEISAYLTSNKVVEAGSKRKKFDVVYNRAHLQKLADEYGVPFNEEVFNDVY